MEEYLPDALLTDAAGLRWLEKYKASNTLTLVSRLLRAQGIGTYDALEAFVEKEEQRCR